MDVSQRKNQANVIVSRLLVLYPDAQCGLQFTDTFQLLISTILSAQTTDMMVNRVSKDLFAQFPDCATLADAEIEEIEELIRPLGLFRNKAKNIKRTARILIDEHNGNVPSTMKELLALSGVGRKTANLVISEGFHIVNGIVVDTHVKRLAQRLGLTDHGDALNVEKDLQQLIPKEKWMWISHALISHGRRKCESRKPKCDTCEISDLCPFVVVNTSGK